MVKKQIVKKVRTNAVKKTILKKPSAVGRKVAANKATKKPSAKMQQKTRKKTYRSVYVAHGAEKGKSSILSPTCRPLLKDYIHENPPYKVLAEEKRKRLAASAFLNFSITPRQLRLSHVANLDFSLASCVWQVWRTQEVRGGTEHDRLQVQKQRMSGQHILRIHGHPVFQIAKNI